MKHLITFVVNDFVEFYPHKDDENLNITKQKKTYK